MMVSTLACPILATPVCVFVPDAALGITSSDRRLVFIGFDIVFLGIDFIYYCLYHFTDFFYAYLVPGKL
jgi:hypothetical protein